MKTHQRPLAPAVPTHVRTRFSADGGVAIAQAPPGGRAHAEARPGRIAVDFGRDRMAFGAPQAAMPATAGLEGLGDRIRAQVDAAIAQAMPAEAPLGAEAPTRVRRRDRQRVDAPPTVMTGPTQAAPAADEPVGRSPQAPVAPQTRPAGPETPAPAPAAPGKAPRREKAEAPTPSAPAATDDTAQLLGAMTAEDVEKVLSDRHSKLAGQGFGAYIVEMEGKYGVPAAQFLAQACMESQIGSDSGYAQPGFNIGNIRPGDSWTGEVVDGGSGPFRVYGSWEEGIEDYFRLLASDTYAGKPLSKQIETYAPPFENDTQHYYDTVCQLIAQWTGIQMPAHTY